ncbi:MAG: hypothetical protein NTW16_05270, partial [Bacteroidetes bacterium]|nr:hypothetical protein [Bacteroidota bacterium]
MMKNVTKMLTMLLLVFATAFMLVPKVSAQTVVLTESFENGGVIPAGWAVDNVSGTTNWVSFVATSTNPAGIVPFNGTWMGRFNSYSAATGQVNRLKRT